MNGRSRSRPTRGLLADAMAGNAALFTREDAVEAAWSVVEPVLKRHARRFPTGVAAGGPRKRTR